ncbi:hypothetical protein DVY02_05960 [Enterococcus faecium]|nr:hypothetical protein [Enterococcus faecium]TKN84482.1 hypothetical protein DVW90_05900 [Enterococcus faecium]TKN84894.1 hypothetical protein DVX12_05940 [Enterococcus faecium]TKO44820.1 hypothetical protein DVY02_05960 [Enterococcus faecium]
MTAAKKDQAHCLVLFGLRNKGVLFAVFFIMHLLPPLFKFRQTGYTGRKVKKRKVSQASGKT